MQYHFDGFRPGDPHVADQMGPTDKSDTDVDVLIVGCGSAGLTLAAQMAAFPDINTRIIERKPGPLQIGQADGIACRSMEMFAAFGFAHRVKHEAYWVNETTFWRPGDDGVLARGDRIQDVEDDLSEMPHVILNQARVHDFYLDVMANGPGRIVPDYDSELVGLVRDGDRVTATLSGPGGTRTVRSRYVVGCDGARSTVRTALGHGLDGAAARQLWGVMDVLAVTDFPDIRLKCAIQSADQGSILIIPREGGAMVRLYIELGTMSGDTRAADMDVTADMLAARARAVLAPYDFQVRQVAWCSAYEIGQRLCDRFDDANDDTSPRIFLAGDACHTHSPKAGQGMNVSMADAFNLGWKLAAVLRGQAPDRLLGTYQAERYAKARELIDFDRELATLFASKSQGAAFAERYQRYFQQHARYTAGVATRYDPSDIVADPAHQDRATGLVVGMRFHSAPVIRLADAKRVELGHVIKADGRWRLIAFAGAGDRGQTGGSVAALCRYLDDRDWVAKLEIDLRAVFQDHHRDLALEAMPKTLLPARGSLRLTDYEKIFCPDLKDGPDIFDLRGIDRSRGALIVVRPDQFVAAVLPTDDHAGLAKMLNRAFGRSVD